MQALSTSPNGFIDRYVSLGEVAVINVARIHGEPLAAGDTGIAPRASVISRRRSDRWTIVATTHPFITGNGIAGTPLTTTDFSNWGFTDTGYLNPVPADATILLPLGNRPR